jgi:hypothetical protein
MPGVGSGVLPPTGFDLSTSAPPPQPDSKIINTQIVDRWQLGLTITSKKIGFGNVSELDSRE